MNEHENDAPNIEFTLNSVSIIADNFVPDLDEDLDISEEV